MKVGTVARRRPNASGVGHVEQRHSLVAQRGHALGSGGLANAAAIFAQAVQAGFLPMQSA